MIFTSIDPGFCPFETDCCSCGHWPRSCDRVCASHCLSCPLCLCYSCWCLRDSDREAPIVQNAPRTGMHLQELVVKNLSAPDAGWVYSGRISNSVSDACMLARRERSVSRGTVQTGCKHILTAISLDQSLHALALSTLQENGITNGGARAWFCSFLTAWHFSCTAVMWASLSCSVTLSYMGQHT